MAPLSQQERNALSGFNSKSLIQRLQTLQKSKNFSDKDLTCVKNLSACVSGLYQYARGTNNEKTGELNNLFLPFSEYVGYFADIKSKIDGMSPTDPSYRDYMEFWSLGKIALSAADNYHMSMNRGILSFSSSAIPHSSTSELSDDCKKAEEELEIATMEDWEDYAESIEQWREEDALSDHPEYSVNQAIHRIGSFYQSASLSHLSEQIHELGEELTEQEKQIPEGMKEYFAGVDSLVDFKNRAAELVQDIKDVRTLASDVTRDVVNAVNDFVTNNRLHVSGFDSTKHETFVSVLMQDMPKIAALSEEDGAKYIRGKFFPVTLGDTITEAAVFSKEATRQLYQFCKTNGKTVGNAMEKRDRLFLYGEKMEAFSKAVELKYKREYLVAAAAQLDKTADRAFSDNAELSFLAKQLPRVEKSGSDTSLYTNFVNSLNDVVNGTGSMEDLLKNAQKYVRRREGLLFGPRSEVGKHRLAIAKQILKVAKAAGFDGKESEKASSAEKTDAKVQQSAKAEVKDAPEKEESKIVNNLTNFRKEAEERAAEEQRRRDRESLTADELDGLIDFGTVNHFYDYFEPAPGQQAIKDGSKEFFREVEKVSGLTDTKPIPGIENPKAGAKYNGYIPIMDDKISYQHDVELPHMLARFLHDDSGRSLAECKKAASMIIRETERNLSGNIALDLKKLYENFDRVLLEPSAEFGNVPFIHNGVGENLNNKLYASVGPLRAFVMNYDNHLTSTGKIQVPKNSLDGRESIMAWQTKDIVTRCNKLKDFGMLQPEYCQTLIDTAQNPDRSIEEKAYLTQVGVDELKELQGANKTQEEFSKALSGKMKEYTKNREARMEQKMDDAKSYIDESVKEQGNGGMQMG